DELHPEDVFTWLKFLGGYEVLFRLDAEEVVNVVQLLVLEEERVPPKARAVREDHAGGVRVGDFDVGQDLERAPADADGYAFRPRRRVWVVEVTIANRLIAGTLDREELRCRPIIQRQDEVLFPNRLASLGRPTKRAASSTKTSTSQNRESNHGFS